MPTAATTAPAPPSAGPWEAPVARPPAVGRGRAVPRPARGDVRVLPVPAPPWARLGRRLLALHQPGPRPREGRGAGGVPAEPVHRGQLGLAVVQPLHLRLGLPAPAGAALCPLRPQLHGLQAARGRPLPGLPHRLRRADPRPHRPAGRRPHRRRAGARQPLHGLDQHRPDRVPLPLLLRARPAGHRERPPSGPPGPPATGPSGCWRRCSARAR